MRLRTTTISRKWASGSNSVQASFSIFDHFANHELLMTLLLVSIFLFSHQNICCSLLEELCTRCESIIHKRWPTTKPHKTIRSTKTQQQNWMESLTKLPTIKLQRQKERKKRRQKTCTKRCRPSSEHSWFCWYEQVIYVQKTGILLLMPVPFESNMFSGVSLLFFWTKYLFFY